MGFRGGSLEESGSVEGRRCGFCILIRVGFRGGTVERYAGRSWNELPKSGR